MRLIILLFSILLFSTWATAATIWCNPANIGTETGTTKATGYKTLWSAMASSSSGDTIVVANGDWSNVAEMTIDSDHKPVNGSDTAYTNLIAETDFSVRLPYIKITGSTEKPISYIIFRGLVFDDNHIRSVSGNFINYLHHIKLIRCGFLTHGLAGNTQTLGLLNSSGDLAYNQYNLVEECLFWGSGRYMLLLWHGQKNIVRRCVIRHDKEQGVGGQDDGQIANYRGYDCQNSLFQNNISIDSDRVSNYTTPLNPEVAGYWIGDQSHGNGNIIDGSISINDTGIGFYLGGNGSMTPNSSSIKDSVVINPTYGVVGDPELFSGIRFQNLDGTVSNCLVYKTQNANVKGISRYSGVVTVNNSIITEIHASAYGLRVDSADKINHYNAGVLYNPPNWGTNSINSNPLTNGLLYPTRTEIGSTLANGSVGPTIMKKTGVSGTIYGETGYDKVTDDNLWPFPNEATIKTLMSTTVAGVSGVYGFTSGTSLDGSPQTLTKYIWEQLGNQIPAEIYGSTGAISPTSYRIPGGVPYGIVQ